MTHEKIQVLAFESKDKLKEWLEINHNKSTGIWVRLYKTKFGMQSVTFLEVLEEGLAYGWSESLRYAFDEKSYLQKFSPRKSKGTTSKRNLAIVEKLIEENRMTMAGYKALGMKEK